MMSAASSVCRAEIANDCRPAPDNALSAAPASGFAEAGIKIEGRPAVPVAATQPGG
jgi:hypothetical protein